MTTTIIDGFIAGDDLQVQRDVSNVEQTDPLIKAWLTIKRTATEVDPGALQKVITTSSGSNGQVIQDGSQSNGDGTASIYFLLTAAETLALGTRKYFHDIQVKTSVGKIYTVEVGHIRFSPGLTDATS